MRIIAWRTLRDFVAERPSANDRNALRSALEAWYAEVQAANWANMTDVRRLYGTASVVSADRVVFNIRGNNYRLVTAIDFEKSIVFIKWIGTHEDYDNIDVLKVQHGE